LPSRLAKAKSSWDQRARKDHVYAAIRRGKHEREPVDLDEVAIEISALAEASAVLDVGCGYGRVLIPTAKHCPGLVVGIDISVEMLRRARDYSRKYAVPAFIVCGSSHMLPFKSNVFEIVYSLLTLQHLPREIAKKSINEIWRVLKPRGLARIQFPNALGFDSAVWWIFRNIWIRILRKHLPADHVRFYLHLQLRTAFGKFYPVQIRGEGFSLIPESLDLRGKRLEITTGSHLNVLRSLLQDKWKRHACLVNLAANFWVEANKPNDHQESALPRT
jgi:SAM-dependent methyltransferase